MNDISLRQLILKLQRDIKCIKCGNCSCNESGGGGTLHTIVYGVQDPLLPGVTPGDVYNQTSDGTASGVLLNTWIWDGTTWFNDSQPKNVTISELLDLAANALLRQSQHYLITDHVQGRLLSGTTILVHAISDTEIGQSVIVNTTYDTTGWFGLYNINTGLITELRDNRNNVAKGYNGTEVTNFDWGNPAISNTTVDNSIWLSTIGSNLFIDSLKVLDNSFVNTTNYISGNIQRTEIKNSSTLDLSGASVSLVNVTLNRQSILSCNNNSSNSVLDNWTLNKSTVNLSDSTTSTSISNITVHESDIYHVNVLTGTITGTNLIVTNNSTINHGNGSGNLSLNRVRINNQSQIVQTQGIVALSNYVVENNSVITLNTGTGGNISLGSGTMSGGAILTNQASYNINGTRFSIYQGSSLTISNGATGTGTFTSSTLNSQSVNTISSSATSGNTLVINTVFDTQGFFQKTSTGVLQIFSSNILSQSRVALSSVRNLSITRLLSNNSSQINSSGATVNITDTITDCTVLDRSIVTMGASGSVGNSMIYNNIRGVNGLVSFNGTSSQNSVQQCMLDNGSIQMTNNNINTLLMLSTSEQQSNIIVSGMTVSKQLQYLNARNISNISVSNPTGAGSHLYIMALNRGNITITGTSTVSQNLYAENFGTIIQNGGQSINLTKKMIGTLTTGNFNHSNVIMINPISQTLTNTNLNRSSYLGLTSSTPLI